MEYKRSDRVADQLRQEVADLLFRKVKDPRVVKVIVTGAQVTDDLRHARIYYCLMGAAGEEEKKNASVGLGKATGFIRQELGNRLRLRYLPRIEFLYDDSIDRGDRIERLLKELHRNERAED